MASLKNQKAKELHWRAAGEPEPETGPRAWEIWLDRIHSAFQWRANRLNGDRQWQKWYRMYQGDHWSDLNQDSAWVSSDNVRDRITVNKTGSIVLSMVPFLISRDIKFLLKPSRPQDGDSAAIQQHLLNYSWREMGALRQVKRSVYDAVIIGHGVVKVAYSFDVDENVDPDAGFLTYESFVKKDSPFIRRVNPFYFVFDPSAPDADLESARWCAEMFLRPLPDVLADELYNSEVRELIRGGAYAPAALTMRSQEPPTNPAPYSAYDSMLPEDNLVVLYEVWDKKFKKRYVFADNVPRPLLEAPWPYEYLDNFPYELVSYIPIPNEPYGIGIPKWIEDQQHELNRVRTSMFEHRRRFNRKYLALEGMIDEEEADKFIDGEDGTVVYGRDPRAITVVQDGQMSNDTPLTEVAINSDLQELSGQDVLIRGGLLQSRATGTEASLRAGLFMGKLGDRVAQIEEFVEAIALQVLKHIKANFLKPKVVELVGPLGDKWPVEVTAENIQADVDVEVESFSAPKTDEDIDKQQWIQVLQIVNQAQPLIDSGRLRIDVNELYALVLEKLGEKEITRFFPEAFGGTSPSPLPLSQAPLQGGDASSPPASPTPAIPGEGLSRQDLRQGIQGAALRNGGFQVG